MTKSICFVVSTPLTINAFLRNHIVELAKKYRIFAIANMDGFQEDVFNGLPFEEVIHVPIVRQILPHKDLLALHMLSKTFEEKKFDVVHSVTPKAGLLAMLASKKAKIKNRIHIFTGQVWHTKKGLMKTILKEIDKIIVKSATHILVDGKSQRNYLIENKIINESNSKVLGMGSISGVDSKKFVPLKDLRKKVRDELNIKDDDVVFSFLGRLNKDKGVKELAFAFDRFSAQYINVKLLFVGYDEAGITNYLKKSLKNTNAVIFFGPAKKPEEILQAADVFCLPSHREGFGTSVLEASLLGLPIICSDTYGLQETIVENITGIRHKVGDEDSILKTLEFLYKNPDKRIEMGVNARKYVLENFSAEQITSEWMRFYEAILNKSSI